MTQALFRIGGVYRNGRGRVVKVADCYDFRTNAMRLGSIAVDSPDDMPQTFHPDLSTGRCELGNPNYSLIPGELHNFNGEWLPVEEERMAPYFAEALEYESIANDMGFSYTAPARTVLPLNAKKYIRFTVSMPEPDPNAAMLARDAANYVARPAAPVVIQEHAKTSHGPIAGLTRLGAVDHLFGTRFVHGD